MKRYYIQMSLKLILADIKLDSYITYINLSIHKISFQRISFKTYMD